MKKKADVGSLSLAVKKVSAGKSGKLALNLTQSMKPQRGGASGFRLYGIFGYPLSHTLSPAMQEAALSHLGLKAFYLAFEMAPNVFRRALKGLPHFLLEGFNVTVPHKEIVMPFLDQVSLDAKIIGAVNTVFKKQGKWYGENTDWKGFLLALREKRFNPARKTALVLGAGGSARAVIFALAKGGAKRVVIANRHPERALKIVRGYRKFFPKTGFEALELHSAELDSSVCLADLVVNTTSVGLKSKDPSLLDAGSILSGRKGKKKLFFDLIYWPEKTSFLKAASRKGHLTANGLEMLLYQGALAFECWTGKKAPVNLMRKALTQALHERVKR